VESGFIHLYVCVVGIMFFSFELLGKMFFVGTFSLKRFLQVTIFRRKKFHEMKSSNKKHFP